MPRAKVLAERKTKKLCSKSIPKTITIIIRLHNLREMHKMVQHSKKNKGKVPGSCQTSNLSNSPGGFRSIPRTLLVIRSSCRCRIWLYLRCSSTHCRMIFIYGRTATIALDPQKRNMCCSENNEMHQGHVLSSGGFQVEKK